MSFDAHGDLCLGFWADALAAAPVSLPPRASVLEIGCAEADWVTPMLAVRPDLHITAIDWRACTRPAHQLIRGDVRVHPFECDSFDAIVSVSAIEHIGLGSYDQDPLDADGDTVTLARAYTWVKPGGWCYLDVPYRPQGPYSVNSNFRAYDPEALQTRLIQSAPWRVRWLQTMGQPSGDGPYVALVLEKPA